jgi:hypothetical protein
MSTLLSGYNVTKPGSNPSPIAGAATGALAVASTYGYKVTFGDGFGETEPSTAGSALTSGTGSMDISSIAVSTNSVVTSRRLYRTVANGAVYKYLATIQDNSTTTYTDLASDAALGANAPLVNTADSRQRVEGWSAFSRPIAVSLEIGITATAGGAGVGAYQLKSEHNFLSVVAAANDSVKLPGITPNTIGLHVTVRNDGANAARIYPFDGQKINALAADAPITVGAAASVELIAVNADTWYQVR